MKFALVSHVLPPSWSGQAVIIYRLLKGLSIDNYCLLSRQKYDTEISSDGYLNRLPAKYYHLRAEFGIAQGNRFGLAKYYKGINGLFGVALRGKHIANVLRREKCDAIVACTADLLDLPAGYLASRLARVPFYPYMFDYYSYQWTHRIDRFFAQRLEPILIKGAAGVIVPNEFLRDELYRRYRVEATVIHNPCEVTGDEQCELPWPADEGKIRIVYTGAVYHAHYDAFRNLVDAIQLLGQSDLKLHLYTAQPPTQLEEQNIYGPIIYHDHQTPSEISQVQRRADILFLPLAFNSQIPEVIRTSAPGKMGEYLASGRPILVHAPADSFVVWYFKKHKCGMVVDQNDATLLAEAIRQIIEDVDLRNNIGDNARECAKKDFSPEVAQSRFLKLLQ